MYILVHLYTRHIHRHLQVVRFPSWQSDSPHPRILRSRIYITYNKTDVRRDWEFKRD